MQQHFNSCGTVNRVTILTDKFGQPKGFAYVEFVEAEAVQEATKLNESELHGRQLKVWIFVLRTADGRFISLGRWWHIDITTLFSRQVAPKRTNVPGMKQPRGRGFNPYHGHPYMRPYGYSPYGYGWVTCLLSYLGIWLPETRTNVWSFPFLMSRAGDFPDSAAHEDLIFEAWFPLQNMNDNQSRFWRRLDCIPAFCYSIAYSGMFSDMVVSVLTMLKLCTVLFQCQLCKTIMI